MAKKPKGPAFLRFIAPVLKALRSLGDSGTVGEVIDLVLEDLHISQAEQAQTTKNGQSRVRNQIGWARFYLSKAGYIQGPQRGVWVLTRKGRETALDEDAVYRLFRDVQDQFKRVVDEIEGAEPVPEEQEETPPDGLVRELDVEPVEGGVEDDGEEEGGEEIHAPYDPAKTHIITKPMSVEQLAKRIGYDEIDLAPDFQRKADLWRDDKKSRLIESMLIRIPLPVFYFDATDDTKWLVVDGLQRLSTIRHFMVFKGVSALRLQGLEYLRQHVGKTFDDLPRDLQRRIEETQVFAHLIQPGTPIEVKYNIFKRINTGGLVLSAQEIRHALHQKKGGATHFLHELADSMEFLEATDHGIPKDRMLDCEFVLRFIAFSITPYKQYSEANMDAFLNRHMKRLNDDGEGEARADLRRRFAQAMRGAARIFGRDAFRKRFAAEERRKPINKALFEVWSVALGNLAPDQVDALVVKKGQVKTRSIALLASDRDFEAAITQGTGDVKRVQKRFSTVEKIIHETVKGAS